MSIQDNISTLATAIGNEIKPFKYIPEKPAAAGNYELAVDAQGQASWATAASGSSGSATLPFTSVWRTSNQTNIKYNNGLLIFNSWGNSGLTDRGIAGKFAFGLNGSILLEANKVYMLRMVLYITGVAAGDLFVVGFNPVISAPGATPVVYDSVFGGNGARFTGRGATDVQTVVHEMVYKPSEATTLWMSVSDTSTLTGSFTMMAGSTATAMQIA